MPHRRRTLRVVFIAQVLTLVGFSCGFPFFPLYIQTFGVTGPAVMLWSGIITFTGSLTLAIASPIWGSLADRYGRKPMLVRGMAGGALLIIAPNIWAVLALRLLQGVLTGTVAPARALHPSGHPAAPGYPALGGSRSPEPRRAGPRAVMQRPSASRR